MQQGRARLETMAVRMVQHAEQVIGQATDTLASLSRGGVAGCTPDDLRFVRDAVITRPVLKEIGVYDASGRIHCTSFGPADLAIDLKSGLPSSGGEARLALIPSRNSGHEALGVLWPGPEQGGLAAIIEPDTVFADLLHGPLRNESHASASLGDGTPIAGTGRSMRDVRAGDPEFIEISASSSSLPLSVTLAAPRAALLSSFATISTFARIGGGVLGVALLVCAGLIARRRPTLEADIDAAIERGEFTAVYQPIIDVAGGTVTGCEVLLRWRKASGETVRPDVFVPIVESTGQIVEITRDLMDRVARDLGEICAEQPHMTVSFNLVAQHFASEELIKDVRKRFENGPLRPENLVFEITERYPLSDLSKAKSVIEMLQAMGCRVALDDAGTGHGGLAYIQSLGMNIIKIDRMFVDAIGTDASKAPIVDALIELGRQLDMTVVAEGVETEEQFAYLRARGTRFFQGYLFSTPLPADAYCRFVRAFSAVGREQADRPAATSAAA